MGQHRCKMGQAGLGLLVLDATIPVLEDFFRAGEKKISENMILFRFPHVERESCNMLQTV